MRKPNRPYLVGPKLALSGHIDAVLGTLKDNWRGLM
jgi:hypothetical protein